MELLFFVVHSVEEIFDVRDLRLGRGEVGEKSLIEHLYSCKFLIQRFHFLQNKSFFDFFVVEHGFEYILISQFQKIGKTVDLINFADMLVLFEMVKQFSVKEDFTVYVLWHLCVVILDKINNLSQRSILFYILEQMLYNLVKCMC